MGETWSILQLFKVYGPKGGILGMLVMGAVAAIRWKVRQISEEKKTVEGERAQLITALNNATQQTLAIVREELRVQQENTVRFFELLDRNTTQLEKMVGQVNLQSASLGVMQTQLARIEGAVTARAAA